MLGAGPLLAQVGGALLAGGILVAAGRQLVPSGRRAYAAVAVVPVTVAALLALPNLRLALSDFRNQRKASQRLPARDAAVRGGLVQGVDVSFLRWVQGRLGPGDKIRLVGPVPPRPPLRTGGQWEQETAQYQWSLFQLAPHLAVDRWEEADWVVLYDRQSSGTYPVRLFEAPQMYRPGYLMARRRRAR